MKKTIEKNLKILESAKTLFMTFSFENVSLSDIAKDAGVETSLVLNYFFNKEYLYDKIFEHVISDFTFSDATEKKDIKNCIDTFFDRFLANPQLLIFILSYLHRMEKKKYLMNPFSNFYDIDICTNIILNNIEETEDFQNTSIEFVTSLMSLFSYPFSLQRLINTISNYNQISYEKFILHRKERITDILTEHPNCKMKILNNPN